MVSLACAIPTAIAATLFLALQHGPISVAVAVLALLVLLLALKCKVFRGEPNMKHVVVLVLGDVGRSPRMQYHCLSLAEMPAQVSLVGYPGEACFPTVVAHPRIKQYLMGPPAFIKKLPRLMGMICKVLVQSGQLFWILLWRLKHTDVLLLQNPPCIPTLLVALIAGFFHDCKIVVDWHNFGYTVLAMSFGSGDQHPLVRAAKAYEFFFGRWCSAGLCVTKAMQRRLSESYGIEASVLYDRPPLHFRRQTLEESTSLFTRLSKEYPEFKEMLGKDAPRLVISSTSWTPDEDFGLLLAAIEALDTQLGPPLLFVITGKGPQKAMYEQRMASMSLKRCRVRTAWLEPEDYPRLLGSATLGVCLHKSTSGCDLPMKVVDMFGAGLPVCAVGFDCLDELVVHGKNGLVFQTSEELAKQIGQLLDNNSTELEHLREGVKQFQSLRWQDNWQASASKFFS